jgi:hypothetical protein
MAWWILFTVCVVACVGVACVGVAMGYWWTSRKSKAREDREIEYLREDPQSPSLQRRDIVSCEGCGCLLGKGSQFKQPSTVVIAWRYESNVNSTWRDPVIYEQIMEHYLCLRCQVDGTPPAKMAEVIDEARAATGGKPC